MRIAIAVEGTRGDVHPMLALGDALAGAGHAIRFCAPPDSAEEVAARGFEFRAVGDAVRSYLESRAGVITRGGLSMIREADRFTRRCVETQLAILPEALRDVDFVFGAGIQVGAATAAELHGVPYRYVAYCPALFPSAGHAPFTLERQDLPGWLNRLGWAFSRATLNVRLRGRVNRARRRLGLGPVGDLVAHMLSERPVLAADRILAPLPADVRFDVERAPCLHAFPDEGLPGKLRHFLEAGPAPVYVGFGSMTDPDPGSTTRRLLDAIAGLGVRAVLSRGWAGLGDGPMPEDVFVTGPVSHAHLFPHVAVVVHHGGAGTTTTAARAGVPQVVVPHVLDQYYWAKRVADLGLGPPPLARRGLEPAGLVRAVGETLAAEVIADRARALGSQLRSEADRWPGAERLLTR